MAETEFSNSDILDLCLGGEYGNPESFVKSIIDTLDLDEYPQQVVDFYVLNVRKFVAICPSFDIQDAHNS